MQKDIFLLLVRTAGRYLIIIFDSGKAKAELAAWLEKNYEEVRIGDSTISFIVNTYQAPHQIAQNILELYSNFQIKQKKQTFSAG